LHWCDEANTAPECTKILKQERAGSGAGPFSVSASGYHLLRGLKPPSWRGLRVSAPKLRSERSLWERPPRSAEDRSPSLLRNSRLKPPLPLKLPLPPE